MKIEVNTKESNEEVKEVKLVRTDDEANKLLNKGWVLLDVATSHIDNMGYNAKPHYILARIK